MILRLLSSFVVAALIAAAAYAQSPVSVIGPVTVGDCIRFFSTTQIQDSGTQSCVTSTSQLPAMTSMTVLSNFTSSTAAPLPVPVNTVNGRFDVRTFGAVADFVTDDSPAFIAAVAAAEQFGSGSQIYVPAGSYCVKNTVTLHNRGVRISGASFGATTVGTCGADVTLFALNNSFQVLEQLFLLGKGAPGNPNDSTFGASNPTVTQGANCGGCFFRDLIIYGGTRNLSINGGIAEIRNVTTSYSYNDALLYMNFAAFVIDSAFNQAWPAPPPSAPSLASIAAWAANTTYATGNVVTCSNYYIQAVSTTGDNKSGAGPGCPTLANYTVNIVDNHVTWQVVSRTNSRAVFADTSAVEFYVHFMDMSGSTDTGLEIDAGSFRCSQCLVSQNITQPIQINNALEVYIVDPIVSASIVLGKAAINMTGTFNGRFTLNGGRVVGDFGMQVSGGVAIATGSFILGTNQAAINVAANVSNFQFMNNSLFGTGTGVNITAGTSNFYTVVGNICVSGLTPCVTDNGTGASKCVGANNGVSANPFPVTCGGTGRNTLTNHGLLVGAGTTAITQLSVGGAGTVLSGVASADPAFTGNPTLGTGSGTPSLTVNGANSGTGGGNNVTGQLNSGFAWGIGNASGLFGGAFSATTVIASANGLKLSTNAGATTPLTAAGNLTINATADISSFDPGPLANSIGGNVALNNTGNFFDGPSTAQGTTGTWWASGTVTLTDTGSAAVFNCKLWDGTTNIATAQTKLATAGTATTISLSGFKAAPAGNIRISCNDPTSTNGLILSSATTLGLDSTVSVVRIK